MNQYLRIGVYLSLVLSLSACRGTKIGSALEGAIAPNSTSAISPAPVQIPISKNLVLPKDFSSDIPIYPKAVLQSIEKSTSSNLVGNSQNTFVRWTTEDSQVQVSSFFEDAFTKQQWRIILRSPDGNFVMQKSDLLLTLSIQKSPQNSTTIFLQYLRDRQIGGDINIAVNPANPLQPNIPANPIPDEVGNFSDITTIPEALRPAIIDLQKLGTINPKQENQFKPNDLVQRRDYARWLVNTNNRIYANRPTRQIRLASANSTPSFADIPPSDPDFAVIQALVNAGLITVDPNPNVTSRRFRPNEPLSREAFLQWKIPLDLRSDLPSANLEAVKQAWGFQDSDRISPINFKFVLADFKLGDLSNIRRSFGYTTLFQPQKHVTRAEAAAALWYFGTPEDGLSAQNALQQNPITTNQPEQKLLERSPDPAISPKQPEKLTNPNNPINKLPELFLPKTPAN